MSSVRLIWDIILSKSAANSITHNLRRTQLVEVYLARMTRRSQCPRSALLSAGGELSLEEGVGPRVGDARADAGAVEAHGGCGLSEEASGRESSPREKGAARGPRSTTEARPPTRRPAAVRVRKR